jgi:hypothetical protein
MSVLLPKGTYAKEALSKSTNITMTDEDMKEVSSTEVS